MSDNIPSSKLVNTTVSLCYFTILLNNKKTNNTVLNNNSRVNAY